MSAPLPDGAVHLVAADDALAEGHRYGTYIALCHALLPASGLPPALCPDDCDRDHPYCPECLREAARRHDVAGHAPAVTFHEDGSWSVHVS